MAAMLQDGVQNAIRELRTPGKSAELEVSLLLLFHLIISFDLVVEVSWYSSTRGPRFEARDDGVVVRKVVPETEDPPGQAALRRPSNAADTACFGRWPVTHFGRISDQNLLPPRSPPPLNPPKTSTHTLAFFTHITIIHTPSSFHFVPASIPWSYSHWRAAWSCWRQTDSH